MKKFIRQTPNDAAAADLTSISAPPRPRSAVCSIQGLQPSHRTARVVQKNQNTLVALESLRRRRCTRARQSPIWVDGPYLLQRWTAHSENRHLIAQLLALAGKPTAGNVHALIPELAGLTLLLRAVANALCQSAEISGQQDQFGNELRDRFGCLACGVFEELVEEFGAIVPPGYDFYGEESSSTNIRMQNSHRTCGRRCSCRSSIRRLRTEDRQFVSRCLAAPRRSRTISNRPTAGAAESAPRKTAMRRRT